MREDEELIERARRGLLASLAGFEGCSMSLQTIDRIMSVVKEHRQRWRGRGVDFPPIVPLINRKTGTIRFVRQDLSRKDIITTVRNFILENPELSALEIAQAVKMAWPDLRTGFLTDETEEHRGRIDASIQRQLLMPEKEESIDTDLIEQAIKNDPSLREHYKEMH